VREPAQAPPGKHTRVPTIPTDEDRHITEISSNNQMVLDGGSSQKMLVNRSAFFHVPLFCTWWDVSVRYFQYSSRSIIQENKFNLSIRKISEIRLIECPIILLILTLSGPARSDFG